MEHFPQRISIFSKQQPEQQQAGRRATRLVRLWSFSFVVDAAYRLRGHQQAEALASGRTEKIVMSGEPAAQVADIDGAEDSCGARS